ncbi:MAG TPA: PQQ-dependent sugar dehydrogenase [Burkholderiales bacterium]|nr:PQQ-dependent sugar dehydrogenase [Burkholderiales bacterium]
MTRLFALLAAFAFIASAHAQAPRSPNPKPVTPPFEVSVFAEGLEHPWGLALLPDGRLLVTERPGRLRLVSREGKLSEPLGGVPEVFARGQGGLLDVALSPRFKEDRTIFLSFAEPGQGGAGTAVARARLEEKNLQDVNVIWRQAPKVSGTNHWGSRLVFARDGSLFITTGDRQEHKDQAQNPANTIGTVVRVQADGAVPKDNPFVADKAKRTEIFSYGHRNIQAAALHPKTGALWVVEHGPRGGDELHRVQAGLNYGWPVITYGVNYDGSRITDKREAPGLEQPAYYWDPVIAPSGALFYTGKAFAGWQGDLLVGSLRPGGLVRLRLDGERVALEERYRRGALDTRVRALVQGPQGEIFAATDQKNGRILRISPRS